MISRSLHLRATALLALALLAGCAGAGPVRGPAAAPAASPVAIAPVLALATFDSAWSRIHNSYYDTTFKGIDWPGVRDELRPRAAAAGSVAELRAVMGEMLDRLGDSHFAIIPAQAADALNPETIRRGEGVPADAGMELRFVGDALLVTRVAPGGAAAAAGIRTGWAVGAIGEREARVWHDAIASTGAGAERDAMRVQAARHANALLAGTDGARRRLRLRDGDDRTVERELVLRPTLGEPVRFGNLPTVMAHLEHERIGAGAACVGVIRFNIWMTQINPAFERAMGELEGCRGIVIDLRGNPGGVGGMVMGMAGYFLAEPVPLGVMQTRQNELRFVANPRRTTSAGVPTRPYAGPVAILIDPLSASTSEIFAAGMQSVGRARLFGETTAGQALPALMLRLPNGDVLYHAIANFTDPAGVRIEGRGAVPDRRVPLARAELLAGRDRPLEAAIEWIRGAAAGAASP